MIRLQRIIVTVPWKEGVPLAPTSAVIATSSSGTSSEAAARLARAKAHAAHTRALPISPPSRPCGLKIRISTGKVKTIASRNGTRPSGR